MRSKSIELKTLAWAIAIVLAGELAAVAMTAHTSLPAMAAQGLVRAGQVCLLLMLVAAIQGKGLAPVGLQEGSFGRGLRRGILWSVIFGLAALLFFAVLHTARFSALELIRTRLPSRTMDLALFFLVGGLIGPIAEEVFFRGIVYGYLRGWGIIAAVAGTTAIFVAAHCLRAGLPLPQIVGGVIFCIAYEMEGSLLTPITIHVLGNMAIFVVSLAARVMR